MKKRKLVTNVISIVFVCITLAIGVSEDMLAASNVEISSTSGERLELSDEQMEVWNHLANPTVLSFEFGDELIASITQSDISEVRGYFSIVTLEKSSTTGAGFARSETNIMKDEEGNWVEWNMLEDSTFDTDVFETYGSVTSDERDWVVELDIFIDGPGFWGERFYILVPNQNEFIKVSEEPVTITQESVTLSVDKYTYSGSENIPMVTAKVGDKTLVKDTDYTLDYQNNINAGTATAIITGIGKYDGSVAKSFTISPANMNNMNITLLESEFNYTGYGHEANFLAMHGERELDYENDFDYSYENNINAGTGRLVITGKGNYTGTVIKYFTIKPVSITDATASLYGTYYTYTGNAFYPGATVTVNRKSLTQGTDFKITHVNNIHAGTATATITGIGNYTGSITRYFYIYAKSIANTNISLSKTKYYYDGKKKEPTVTVKDGTKKLVKGTDYTVTYSNNKKIGTATVTITGKGNYTGTVSKTFSIKEKKGTTFESGSYKYKITGTNTVSFEGIKKSKIAKTTTVKIADTVKYGGATFKVTSIADKALYKKTKVKSVTIGKNVTKIGKSAFEGCKKLKTITVKTTKLKSSKYVGKNALKGINSKASIKVSKSKLKLYKKVFKGKGQAKTVTIKK